MNLRLNYASSGILERQIASGADCDYYISASQKWMDYVKNLHLMDEKSIVCLAQNSLVAIVPTDSKLSQFDLDRFPELFGGRIFIGDPAHVPAGRYAQEIISCHQ